jgi:hypothetical protein
MPMYMSYDDLPKLKLPYGQEVFVCDSTLRDGAQMPGIVIPVRHRLKIFLICLSSGSEQRFLTNYGRIEIDLPCHAEIKNNYDTSYTLFCPEEQHSVVQSE